VAPPVAALSYQGLWWNPNESGWGMSVSQHNSMIFAAFYTYDTAGKSIWYVASNCVVAGSGCSGEVYQVSGGTPLTAAWNGAGKTVLTVGTVTFAFADAGNGAMTYSINGATGSRLITRQVF